MRLTTLRSILARMHNPPWLDSERRRTVEVTADVIHAACPCEWVPTKTPGAKGRWKLAIRKRTCVIHGVNGHI